MLINEDLIKELICLVHDVCLGTYELVTIHKPEDSGDCFVIFKNLFCDTVNGYIVYTLPRHIYTLVVNNKFSVAFETAKQIGVNSKIEYYETMLKGIGTKSDYYLKQLEELKGSNGNHS